MSSTMLIGKGDNKVDLEINGYRGIIGYLLCLTTSPPNIMFSVCMYARYQTSPKEFHFKIVELILRYLNGTSQHCLWYPKGSPCSLLGFFYFDFVGCKSDRKSACGTCHLFGSYLVS